MPWANKPLPTHAACLPAFARLLVLLEQPTFFLDRILGLPDKQARVLAGLGALLQKYPGATLATSQMCIAECMVGARRLPDPLQRQAAQSELEREFSKPDLLVVQVTSPRCFGDRKRCGLQLSRRWRSNDRGRLGG